MIGIDTGSTYYESSKMFQATSSKGHVASAVVDSDDTVTITIQAASE